MNRYLQFLTCKIGHYKFMISNLRMEQNDRWSNCSSSSIASMGLSIANLLTLENKLHKKNWKKSPKLEKKSPKSVGRGRVDQTGLATVRSRSGPVPVQTVARPVRSTVLDFANIRSTVQDGPVRSWTDEHP